MPTCRSLRICHWWCNWIRWMRVKSCSRKIINPSALKSSSLLFLLFGGPFGFEWIVQVSYPYWFWVKWLVYCIDLCQYSRYTCSEETAPYQPCWMFNSLVGKIQNPHHHSQFLFFYWISLCFLKPREFIPSIKYTSITLISNSLIVKVLIKCQ